MGTPMGAEGTHDFAMDDGMPQGAFGNIVGRLDIGAIEKDKQALAILEITPKEFGRLRLFEVAL